MELGFYTWIFGILTGLILGFVLESIGPNRVHYGIVGLFSGLGFDYGLNFFSDSPEKIEKTLVTIQQIGNVVGNILAGLITNEKNADLEFLERIQKTTTNGIWCILIVIALIFVVSDIIQTRSNTVAPSSEVTNIEN